MTYYILANQFDGQLIQASTDFLEQGPGQLIIVREGQIPDLEKFEWHNGSLAFIEKNQSRWMSQVRFLNRIKHDELVGIYTLAETDTNVKIWLDKFKMAKEIFLDDPEIQANLPLFELAGILKPGRAAEILS